MDAGRRNKCISCANPVQAEAVAKGTKQCSPCTSERNMRTFEGRNRCPAIVVQACGRRMDCSWAVWCRPSTQTDLGKCPPRIIPRHVLCFDHAETFGADPDYRGSKLKARDLLDPKGVMRRPVFAKASTGGWYEDVKLAGRPPYEISDLPSRWLEAHAFDPKKLLASLVPAPLGSGHSASTQSGLATMIQPSQNQAPPHTGRPPYDQGLQHPSKPLEKHVVQHPSGPSTTLASGPLGSHTPATNPNPNSHASGPLTQHGVSGSPALEQAGRGHCCVRCKDGHDIVSILIGSERFPLCKKCDMMWQSMLLTAMVNERVTEYFDTSNLRSRFEKFSNENIM